MPIYEYRCEACGAPREAIQKMSDAPLTRCEACGADALQRVISKTSFVLKGSGWYVTDYKSPSGGAKTDAKSEPGAAKSDTPKSDAPKSDAPKSESKAAASGGSDG